MLELRLVALCWTRPYSGCPHGCFILVSKQSIQETRMVSLPCIIISVAHAWADERNSMSQQDILVIISKSVSVHIWQATRSPWSSNVNYTDCLARSTANSSINWAGCNNMHREYRQTYVSIYKYICTQAYNIFEKTVIYCLTQFHNCQQ